MESNQKEDLTDARPVPVYVLPCADRDDEISLVELWRVIVARKSLILLSLLASILLASAYIFLTEPLYQAETYLLHPQQHDIQGLMLDYGSKERTEIYRHPSDSTSPEEAYPELAFKVFLNNIKSKGLRKEFFDTRDLGKHYAADKADINRIFNTKFNERMQVKVSKKRAHVVTAAFSSEDPRLAAQWLNQFIAFADERTVQQLSDDVSAEIQAEIERIDIQLASKLKQGKQKRNDEIIRLQEALRLATELSIKGAGSIPAEPGKKQDTIVINTVDAPLYMRGERALKAEIAVLESRKSDEPFIEGLRDLQERLAFLKNLSIERKNLSAVTIDTAASTPYQAEKPRKKLILALATLFGLMAGVFLVIIAELRSKVRAETSQPAA